MSSVDYTQDEREQGAGRSGMTHDSMARTRMIPRITVQAFCENEETAQVISGASADRRLAKSHVTVQMGGIRAAKSFYQSAPTPNLIIIESLNDRDTMLSDLDQLAESCDTGTKVLVIGNVNDVVLYRSLMQRGVSEYMVAPLQSYQVIDVIANLYTDPDAEPVGEVIAFIGAKGGAGSSTICHNTAWAMSKITSTDVVITDFDLPFGTAGLDFDQDPVQGIADALTAPDRLDEVLLDRLLTKCSENLSLFAAPSTLDHVYDLSEKQCSTVIDIVRSNLPYAFVDVPHMWTGWSRQMLIHADDIVITATPDLASLRNTKNLVDLIKKERNNDEPPHIVLNQVNVPKRPEISIGDFNKSLDRDVEVVIDFNPQLFGTAANNGQMIAEYEPKSKASEQFNELASRIAHISGEKVESGSAFAKLLGKLNRK
jgi:pilus assembly protein CpaE